MLNPVEGLRKKKLREKPWLHSVANNVQFFGQNLMERISMANQVLSVVSGVLAIGSFLVWLGRMIYRQAAAPKGYAAVLTGVSIVSVITLAGVVVLFFTR